MKHFLIPLFIISTAISYSKEPDARAPAQAPTTPNGIMYSVYEYRESEPERAGQLGIAHPADAQEALPIVICIHGGAWAKGDKDQMAWMAIRYAQRGYIGVTLSYRLNHEAPLPACIYDVKEAVRYLKSISDEIGADSERIAVLGYSAGAHLALMIALTPDNTFKSDTYPEYDASVDCAVAISTPADLSERLQRLGELRFLSEEHATDADFIRSIDPMNWVNPDQIPVLMLHGDQDPIVPAYNYENFATQCEKQGIDNFELYVNEGGKHMFFFEEQKITHPIVDGFLKQHLTP